MHFRHNYLILLDPNAYFSTTKISCHLPERFKIGIVPVKICRDIVSGDREGEASSGGVPFHHDLRKCSIDHIHFFLEFRIRFFSCFTSNYDGAIH